MVLRQSCAADLAHVRSHAGPGSSDVLSGAPTGPEFRVCPELFRTLVLERLRLPFEVVESQCECGSVLDTLGRHRAACPRSGRLRTRAGPPERTMARICREAGATVRFNTRLREMNVAVSANDERSIEVLASCVAFASRSTIGIRCHSQMCPHVRRERAPPSGFHERGGPDPRPGGQGEEERLNFLESEWCRLVVVALETGGRWSTEAKEFVDSLAVARAREAPRILWRSAFLGWRRRWSRMFAVSCARAFAALVVALPAAALPGTDGPFT